ncbi:MAG: hypothetical protein ACRD3W_13045, partial [Terriglobales bacterium]
MAGDSKNGAPGAVAASPPHAVPDKLTLEKASIDLASVQTQMVLGALALFVICLLQFPALSSVPNIAGVNPADAANHPAVLAALKLAGQTVWAQHLLALTILYGSAVMVSLITLELTGPTGNRLGACPAVWAGLLFASYPVHSAGIVVGAQTLGTLLATFFSLTSLFMFQRFSLLKERKYWALSVLCYLVAGLSSSGAIVLPAVIFLFCAACIGQASLKDERFEQAYSALPWLLGHIIVLPLCYLFGGGETAAPSGSLALCDPQRVMQ